MIGPCFVSLSSPPPFSRPAASSTAPWNPRPHPSSLPLLPIACSGWLSEAAPNGWVNQSRLYHSSGHQPWHGAMDRLEHELCFYWIGCFSRRGSILFSFPLLPSCFGSIAISSVRSPSLRPSLGQKLSANQSALTTHVPPPEAQGAQPERKT